MYEYAWKKYLGSSTKWSEPDYETNTQYYSVSFDDDSGLATTYTKGLTVTDPYSGSKSTAKYTNYDASTGDTDEDHHYYVFSYDKDPNKAIDTGFEIKLENVQGMYGYDQTDWDYDSSKEDFKLADDPTKKTSIYGMDESDINNKELLGLPVLVYDGDDTEPLADREDTVYTYDMVRDITGEGDYVLWNE
jgi:hypothetical protein